MAVQDKYSTQFLVITVVIVGLSVAFPFVINSFFHDWDKSGTFGDTFGALNAIYSGVAVAALMITVWMQRKELENQRTELSLQRREFSMNRITSIIYSQLQRFEKATEQLRIKNGGKEYIGYEAIFFLDTSKKTTFNPVSDKRTADEILEEKKQKNCYAMKIYSENNQAIAQFSLSAYNAAGVVKEVLYKSDLTDYSGVFDPPIPVTISPTL